MIDLSKKKIITADVDQTICESCQVISDNMVKEITRLTNKGYIFVFISGTDCKNLTKMISSKLKTEHYILGTEGTECVYVKNKKIELKYKFTLKEEERKAIISAFNRLIDKYNIQPLTSKEDQLLDRKSQITFSAIGRNAPYEKKINFDPDFKKRKEWINFLKEYIDLTKFEIKIGGTTSLDVTKKDVNKGQGLKLFIEKNNLNKQEIIFLGDRIFPGGNDYSIKDVVDWILVKNPKNTLEIFKKI